MSLGPEHVVAVTKAADKIHEAAVMLAASPVIRGAPANAGGNSTVNVTGGWPIAISGAIAAVCLYIAADSRADASELRNEARDLGRRVERREDYLNMLWQRYPELRPEKLQEVKK